MGRLPADDERRGKTIFVPFVVPGEQVDVTLIQNRPGFARARLNKVVVASSDRVAPDCPYFGRCGGCHYQHVAYEAQLRFKAEILRETLRRTAKLELSADITVHHSQPWHYRNRTRMHVRHTPTFAVGYFRTNSHELLPVESCPISSPLINRALAAFLQSGHSGTTPAYVHGVQFLVNHDDTALIVELFVHPGGDQRAVDEFGRALMKALEPVIGVATFATSPVEDETRQHAPFASAHDELPIVAGVGSITYAAAGHEYRVSAGSFFQTNRFLVDELVKAAIAGANGKLALDLYAGVGLFTLPLAGKFDEVMAVEASPHSVADLQHNAPPNVKAVRATTEAFLEQQAVWLKPNFVLLDPPRAGLGDRATIALGKSSASMVTLVSCDPATLSRDLRRLLESGFAVEQAHLFDLFPHTAHMETVLRLTR